eukprot:204071_1
MIPGNNIPTSNIAFVVQQQPVQPQPIVLVQTTPNVTFPFIQQPPPPQQQILVINNNPSLDLVYSHGQPHIISTTSHTHNQPTLNMTMIPQQFAINSNHNMCINRPTQMPNLNMHHIPTMPSLPSAPPSMLLRHKQLTVSDAKIGHVNVARCQNVQQTQRPVSRSMNPDSNPVNKLFECAVCGKKYKYLCNYKLHYKIHTDDCYKCSFCGKKFGRKSNYKEHERVHTGETPYECRFCSKKFKQRHGWMSHLRRHTGQKPFHCDICDEQFSVRQNLSIHKRTHTGERPFECDLCPKAYRQKSALNSHIANVHQKAASK